MPISKSSYEGIVGTVLTYYHSHKMKEVYTVSCTATNCLVVTPGKFPIAGTSSVVVFFKSDEQVKAELYSLLDTGYEFTERDVSRTVSIHQNRLKDAKLKLLTEVLTKPNNAYARQDVILNLGIALNLQVDIDPLIHGNNSIRESILEKLRVLGLATMNHELFEKYKSLNKFYNAVKHRGRPENVKNVEKLKELVGLAITIDY